MTWTWAPSHIDFKKFRMHWLLTSLTHMRPKGLWSWHSDCLRFLHSASPYPYQLHLDTFQKVALVTTLNTFSQLATPSSVRSLPYKLRKSWKLTQFLACIYMESFDSFLSKHVCLVSANTWSKVESIFVLTSLYDTVFSIKTTWRKKSFINLSHQFSVQWNGKAFFFFWVPGLELLLKYFLW